MSGRTRQQETEALGKTNVSGVDISAADAAHQRVPVEKPGVSKANEDISAHARMRDVNKPELAHKNLSTKQKDLEKEDIPKNPELAK